MIPFNRPTSAPSTLAYVERALASQHLSGDGPFTSSCERRLGELVGSARVLLTTSCTHALELAALLLKVGPGDEVIMPSFNFPSAANAFVLRGATPVWVDVRPDTLNIAEAQIEEAISPRTKAIVVVHYAGVACDMDAISRIAAAHHIPVVEDIAHSLFGSFDGQPTGSIGDLATASFHETKNITCGEGGALFIASDALVERAEIIREKGTNRSQFHRGEVDKYSWTDLGSSYLPSELLAAALLAQLDHLEVILSQRSHAWLRYRQDLGGWAAENSVELPVVPDQCASSHHLFHMLLPTEADRDRLLEHLRERGVLAVFHYLPLHLSPMGRKLGGHEGQLPVTESASARLLRLPLFSDITAAEQGHVIDAVRAFAT